MCVCAHPHAHVQLHGVRLHACHGAHVELREHLCQSILFEMSSCWLTTPSPQHAGPAYCFNTSSFYFVSGDLNAHAALARQALHPLRSPQPPIILCYELRVYTISSDRNCLFIHIFKSYYF